MHHIFSVPYRQIQLLDEIMKAYCLDEHYGGLIFYPPADEDLIELEKRKFVFSEHDQKTIWFITDQGKTFLYAYHTLADLIQNK